MNALNKRMVDISDGLEDVPVLCKDPITPTFKVTVVDVIRDSIFMLLCIYLIP